MKILATVCFVFAGQLSKSCNCIVLGFLAARHILQCGGPCMVDINYLMYVAPHLDWLPNQHCINAGPTLLVVIVGSLLQHILK